MFDESGDGALDVDELEKLLRTFGQNPTKEKVGEALLIEAVYANLGDCVLWVSAHSTRCAKTRTLGVGDHSRGMDKRNRVQF